MVTYAIIVFNIFSFGSGFNIESHNETYIIEVGEIVQYAKAKGIEVGGYDLIALDRATSNADWAALSANLKPTGNSCMASAW